MGDFIAALSHGDFTAPMESLMPFPLIFFDAGTETYWVPWSLRWTQPSAGRCLAIAVLSASSASSASRISETGQDPLNMSTKANLASFGVAAAADGWRRRRLLLKVSRSPV